MGFIGPTYQAQSKNVDCQRCINLYPQMDELGTGKEREVACLVSTPGLATLLTLAGGAYRGSFTSTAGVLYAVGGNKLYSITSAWVATELGTLLTTTGKVNMADDGFNLVLVDGPNGYNWNLTSLLFTQITDGNFHGSDVVQFVDGYFVFNWPGTGYFYVSELPTTDPNTGLPVDATTPIAFANDPAQIANAEGSADIIVSIVATNENVWLFGDKTTEIWYDAGLSPGMPFERVQGAFVEFGCAAKFSPARLANTVFWLGKNEQGQGVVVMANGYQPQRISTHPVESAIQSYSDISDAISYTYQENGHNFYVLNFPTGDATWVYDTATGFWHERAYTSNGELGRHRANGHSFAYQTHVVGDYATGQIYQLSDSLYSDDGAPITRERVSPHVSSDMVRMFYSKFQLDIEGGTGLDGIGQGTDPQVMLQFSDDGGHTWSNEKQVSLGKIGRTKHRVIFRRLGSSRDRVFRVKITDPVRVTLIGAELDVMAGAS